MPPLRLVTTTMCKRRMKRRSSILSRQPFALGVGTSCGDRDGALSHVGSQLYVATTRQAPIRIRRTLNLLPPRSSSRCHRRHALRGLDEALVDRDWKTDPLVHKRKPKSRCNRRMAPHVAPAAAPSSPRWKPPPAPRPTATTSSVTFLPRGPRPNQHPNCKTQRLDCLVTQTLHIALWTIWVAALDDPLLEHTYLQSSPGWKLAPLLLCSCWTDLPLTTVRICEYRRGRWKTSDLVVLLLLHGLCIQVVAWGWKAAGLAVAARSTDPADMLSWTDGLTEVVASCGWVLLVLVGPVLCRLNRIPCACLLLLAYPLCALPAGGRGSTLTPTALLVKEAPTVDCYVRSGLQLLGGWCAGEIMVRYFPDD